MSREREHRIVAGHAGTVVTDPYKLAAAILDGDVDGGGAGIECVLDELFHHRCGTLDHFAGSDLVGYGTGKNRDDGGHRVRSVLVDSCAPLERGEARRLDPALAFVIE